VSASDRYSPLSSKCKRQSEAVLTIRT
jgi:hypothetical protein